MPIRGSCCCCSFPATIDVDLSGVIGSCGLACNGNVKELLPDATSPTTTYWFEQKYTVSTTGRATIPLCNACNGTALNGTTNVSVYEGSTPWTITKSWHTAAATGTCVNPHANAAKCSTTIGLRARVEFNSTCPGANIYNIEGLYVFAEYDNAGWNSTNCSATGAACADNCTIFGHTHSGIVQARNTSSASFNTITSGNYVAGSSLFELWNLCGRDTVAAPDIGQVVFGEAGSCHSSVSLSPTTGTTLATIQEKQNGCSDLTACGQQRAGTVGQDHTFSPRGGQIVISGLTGPC